MDESIRSACTGCGACVEACPQHIVILDHRNLASVDLTDAECTFCSFALEACEEGVFDRAQVPIFAYAARIGMECFATRGIVCQSCGETCPEDAIRFQVRIGGPALPLLDPDRCSGCGACVGACPAEAIVMAPREAETCHGSAQVHDRSYFERRRLRPPGALRGGSLGGLPLFRQRKFTSSRDGKISSSWKEAASAPSESALPPIAGMDGVLAANLVFEQVASLDELGEPALT